MVRVFLLGSLLVLFTACSDEDKQALMAGDSSAASLDLGVDMPYSLAGACAGCFDHVIDQVLMPKNQGDLQACAVEHKGRQFNALGNVMIPLILTLTEFNTQELPDKAIHSGAALNLLRLQAADLKDAALVTGQLWAAKAMTCCKTPDAVKTCTAEAYKTCFGGSGAFTPDPKAPAATAIKGSIKGGKLTLGPGKVMARFPLMGPVPLDLPVSMGRISGNLSKTGLTGGCLTGAITGQDMDKVLLPRLAAWLNGIPKTDPNKKTYLPLENLLDTDKDGTISVAEIKQNGLLKTFLEGDADLDGDGKLDMTLGFRFSAVRAVIKP